MMALMTPESGAIHWSKTSGNIVERARCVIQGSVLIFPSRSIRMIRVKSLGHRVSTRQQRQLASMKDGCVRKLQVVLCDSDIDDSTAKGRKFKRPHHAVVVASRIDDHIGKPAIAKIA